MKNQLIQILIFIVVTFVLTNCFSTQKSHPTSAQKTSLSVKEKNIFFEKTSAGTIKFFLKDDSETEIYFTADISRQRNFNDSDNIQVIFFPEKEPTHTLYEGKCQKQVTAEYLSGKFSLTNTITPGKYIVKIINLKTAQDITIQEYFNGNNPENYFIMVDSNGFMPVQSYVPVHKTFRFQKNKNISLMLYRKTDDPPFPPPPFIENYIPREKNWSPLCILQHDSSISFSTPASYMIKDQQMRFISGFLTVHDAFPNLYDEKEMIEATRYIMNKDEFNRCYYSEERKKEIELFWKNIGGSKERARELIRQYYNRVIDANRFFSDYIAPGYKTDRGMIYIIFGNPDHIYKTNQSEIWHYGKNEDKSIVNFTFLYKNGEYILERSSVYKDFWYQMVDNWRQGKVYVFDR
jgi:GWxTD domain-containing protein